jgi:hypothetical protein
MQTFCIAVKYNSVISPTLLCHSVQPSCSQDYIEEKAKK